MKFAQGVCNSCPPVRQWQQFIICVNGESTMMFLNAGQKTKYVRTMVITLQANEEYRVFIPANERGTEII